MSHKQQINYTEFKEADFGNLFFNYNYLDIKELVILLQSFLEEGYTDMCIEINAHTKYGFHAETYLYKIDE